MSEVAAPAELPPAGPVERDCAAIELVYVPAVAVFTVKVMEHSPLDGIIAPLKLTALAELVKVPEAPAQVVVGAGELSMVKLAGTVSVNADWVNAKPLAFAKVMVSVAAAFSVTVAGENDSLIVGATGATVIGVGQALTVVPAEVGALIVTAP